ncbi:MAG TPA: enoyl-CoA hydratase/isomerase family protein [Opitutaceae bacterium]
MPNAPLIHINGDLPHTTVLTLNRPEKRNALNIAVLEELCLALAAVEKDLAKRVLVVRGAGPVFCAGLDLAEAVVPEAAHLSAELIARALRSLAGSRLVTIAAVHGAAIAGGAGLMSACDLVVATREAKIAYPEVQRGLVASLVMTFLRRQVRERDAREILLLGETFDAARAAQLGLVNRVVADEAELALETRRLAEAAMRGAPEAIANTKKLLTDLWPRTVERDLEHALAFHLSARHSPEAQEGIAAFREKRPPRWAER